MGCSRCESVRGKHGRTFVCKDCFEAKFEGVSRSAVLEQDPVLAVDDIHMWPTRERIPIRGDLLGAGIPLGPLARWEGAEGDSFDTWDDVIDQLDGRDEDRDVESLIESLSDGDPEKAALLEALSAGHSIAEASRLTGFGLDRAAKFLRRLRDRHYIAPLVDGE